VAKQDITRVEHLNQALRAISNLHRLFFREKDPERLIEQACEILVEARRYRAVWIALDGQGGQPSLVAQAGWGEAFEPFGERLRKGRLPPCRSKARAAEKGIAVLYPRQTCRECPLREAYGHDVAGVAPLRHGDRDFGAIGLCLAPGPEIDDEEKSLLLEVAGCIAFALWSIETETGRRQIDEQFELSFENPNIGKSLTAPDGRLARINRAFCDLLGYSREEMEAMNFADVTHADDQAKSRECVRCLLDGERSSYRMEKRYVRKDGQSVWAEVSTVLMRDEDGSPKFFITHVLDMSERKRAEEALRESEQRFRILFEQAADSILLLEITPEGVPIIRDANGAAIRILGYKRDELMGRPISFIDAAPDASKLMSERRRNILSSAGTMFEARHCCKDGGVRDFECSVTEMQIGTKTFAISVERDITERKRLEAEHKKLEEQLRVSQKMEAVGSLAGGIAHDFNNLLSVILSYTFFAAEGLPDDDPRGDDLKEVKLAAERAVALTRQLLAFSRKQMLQPVPLNLNRIAEGVEKMLRRILGEDIDFLQSLSPDLGVDRADPGQMEQVLMNLAVNARDAMSAGGKLTIETSNIEIDEEYAARHVDARPGPYVMLAITDTGGGMDEETKARLFEPFFTTKEKGKGTGLGLSTVYGIVKQSGGNIWVYSELGQGTVFKIYLPRELDATAEAVKVMSTPKACIGTETILLVEDEEALRKVAKRALDAVGYKVLIAADGDEALLVSEQYAGDIHLLLTDVVMPGMSGRALAQELLKTRPDLKVLYMSGYTDNAIVHHGVLDAGTHFMGKPFTAADLTQKVREVLDGGVDPGARYERTVETDVETKDRPLERDALRALPKEVLDKLRKAVVAARYDEIIELTEIIRQENPDVATGLSRMADQFDYNGMRNLLGRREEEPSDG
jgi:two-component system cell cycle sensor histidine kinase/response regulator CckA